LTLKGEKGWHGKVARNQKGTRGGETAYALNQRFQKREGELAFL